MLRLVFYFIVFMQTRAKPEDYTMITLHPQRFQFRKSNHVAQMRILPSLRRMVQDEPINFIRYQRNKKTRKIKIMQNQLEQQLFLEGEYFSALPNNPRGNRQKKTLIDITTIPQLERKEENKTVYKHKQSSLIRQSSEKKEQSKKNLPKQNEKKDLTPYIPRGKLYKSTIQPQNRQSKVSLSMTKNLNYNRSQNTLKSVELDRQKQLLFLEKKQLQKIKAESFIVLEHPSKKIITGNRFKNPAEIASLTKIMTFYTIIQLSIQHQLDLKSIKVTVEETASNMTGTTAELVIGDTLTVQELLYGLMLPSGNDAAVTLAIWGGSITQHPEEVSHLQAFISLMNKNAKDLDLKNSTFSNPHGLPHFRNVSTPYDLAILTSECLKIPLFLQVTRTQEFKVWVTNEGGKKELIWQNTNKLLRREGFISGKTGVTVTAGPCLASCYQYGDKKFIVILLRTNKLSRRFKQTRLILGWALKKYDTTYQAASKKILRHDAMLDSDNSQEEQQFFYDRMDAEQMAKRNKILQFQL